MFRLKCVILLCGLIFSCARKNSSATQNAGEIAVSDSKKGGDILLPTQMWHQTDKCVCVVFGYGYNDETFTTEMKSMLFEKFGDVSDGGYILSYVFPDDFKRGSKTFITNLEWHLEGKNLCGIIFIGAPENTHTAIARMQDKNGGSLPYPVFSFFSQDDVLGMEDSADFVLDKAQKAAIDGIVVEEEQSFVGEVPEMLEKAVQYILWSDGPFEKNQQLIDFVRMIAGDFKIQHYFDPETNLPAINHFVIE